VHRLNLTRLSRIKFGVIGSDINAMMTFIYYELRFLQKRLRRVQIILFSVWNGPAWISCM